MQHSAFRLGEDGCGVSGACDSSGEETVLQLGHIVGFPPGRNKKRWLYKWNRFLQLQRVEKGPLLALEFLYSYE